jgi:Fur family transcriptional regulator, ferric uptake regulator
MSITSETKSHLDGQKREKWMRTHAAARGRRKEGMMIAEKIYAAFDEVSQRNTRPRKLIADRLIELAGLGADFTVEDLWQELRQVEPRIGRATVYRAVEKLVHMGLLARIEFADGTHHYRVCGGNEHHHHLTCTQCHRVVEINICLPADQFTTIGNQADFVIEGHALTLFGRCKNCRT